MYQEHFSRMIFTQVSLNSLQIIFACYWKKRTVLLLGKGRLRKEPQTSGAKKIFIFSVLAKIVVFLQH